MIRDGFPSKSLLEHRRQIASKQKVELREVLIYLVLIVLILFVGALFSC